VTALPRSRQASEARVLFAEQRPGATIGAGFNRRLERQPPPGPLLSTLHTPPLHFLPNGQTAPHAPQFAASFMKSTQTPTHSSDWSSHFGATHTPPMQVAAPAQALPHAPQLAGSFFGSTQRPPHDIVLAAQAQVPPTHTAPPVHVTPQPPQFVGLDVRLTQPLVHDMVPMGHVISHLPALHT